MEPSIPTSFVQAGRFRAIHSADSFERLDLRLSEALNRAAGAIWGGIALVLTLPEAGEGQGLAVNRPLLNRRRHLCSIPLGRLGMELISSIDEPCRLDRLDDPLGRIERWPAPPLKTDDETCLFGAPLQRLGAPAGVLLTAVDAVEAASREAELVGLLAEAAQSVSFILPAIYAAEIMEDRQRQTDRVQTTLMRMLTAVDRPTLLSHVMMHLTRDFAFDRVQILLVRPETQQLHCAMHMGFASSPQPVDGSPEQRTEFFFNAIKNGEVRILTPDLPEFKETPNFGARDICSRIGILPLKVGAQMLGCIYTEQAAGRGGLIFMPILENFARLVAVALDNLDQRIAAESRAQTDPLTGLHNRYYLDKVLSAEVPRVKRYDTPISLLMIDLCDFKSTNDTYGHMFGDFILRESANLIKASVRRPDIVVRYGGDEFVVLMVNTGYEQAQMVRNRIEQSFVERNRMQSEDRMKIVISVGLRSANAITIGELIENADEAMYDHKASIKRRGLLTALIHDDLEKIENQHHVVSSLCSILNKKIPYYAEHARRVCHLCLILARGMELRREDAETLALAAMLHDVGKVSVPFELLNKKETLTQHEVMVMQKHPVVGEMFFEGIDYLEPIRPLIRHHHESWDGCDRGLSGGYPDQLEGDEIPLMARILCLAENADGMLGGRPYLPLVSLGEIEQYFNKQSGGVFDPQLTALLNEEKGWHHNLGRPSVILELLQAF